jgi:hypothetical protein
LSTLYTACTVQDGSKGKVASVRRLSGIGIVLVAFIVFGLILLYFNGQQATDAVVTAAAVASNTTSGHAGPARLYPDPKLTPGATVPGVTATQVCKPGYATSVRSVSSAEKAEVYRRYGEQNVTGRDEVDHFISLEIGGSNDVTNLWPEPYAPAPGAHEKDKVENYLHAQVCSGAMTLPQAQQAIRNDWYAVYLHLAS